MTAEVILAILVALAGVALAAAALHQIAEERKERERLARIVNKHIDREKQQ